MKNFSKNILIFCLITFISIQHFPQTGLVNQKTETNPRIITSINEAWKFFDGDTPNAEAPKLNDKSWENINLPHTWNAKDIDTKTGKYRRGIGWYRKNLFIKKEFAGKKLFLKFEAANQVAEVYVNGNFAGKHTGGYTAFTFNITALSEYGKENVIAVKVDNSHNPDIPPLDADFTFYGGIYRDVWLIAVESIHFDLTRYSSDGIYISTPSVSNESAKVNINCNIVNENANDVKIKLVHKILDENKNLVLTSERFINIPHGSKDEFILDELIVESPKIWSPRHPYLYTLSSEIYLDNKLIDNLLNPLGFRWFSIDGQNGLMLNGEKIKLYGTNRHQDYPLIGNAVPDDKHVSDVKIIKENGFTFLRLAHYPQDGSILNACDREGLIVWEEIPVVNTITMSEEFKDNCELMLSEMMMQHYNHPSVFLWSYMNEIMLRVPNPVPEGYIDFVVSLAKRLENIVKTVDPNRLTVMALSSGGIDNGTGIGDITDIIGFNLYYGWYYKELDDLGKFIDQFHEKYPERPVIISEYGAGSDERIHTNNPVSFDFSTEYQQLFHESHFSQIIRRDYLTGSAIWNQFDFGSKGRQDSKNGINQKGIYYFDHTPKDISYYYKSNLSRLPTIHIALRDQKTFGIVDHDQINKVKIYSNLDEVNLFVNDNNSLTLKPQNRTAVFDVKFQPGKNILHAEGKSGGQLVSDTISIFVVEAELKIIGDSILLNAGSHYSYSTEVNNYWFAGDIKNEDMWSFSGGRNHLSHHRIYNSNDDPLFQSSLEGIDSFFINVSEGEYELSLGFCENVYNHSGERVFDILINGVKIIEQIDLYGEAGKHAAIIKKVPIEVNENRKIKLKFIPVKGEPTLSSLTIKRLK